MNAVKLSLDLVNASEHADLGIEIWLDQHRFFDHNLSPGTHHVIHEFADDDQEHQLRIKLKNKQSFHTKIDEQGHIVHDAVININNIELNGISVNELIWKMAHYVHDCNGTQDTRLDKFFGSVGCNGEIKLDFQCPVYLWLLEHL